METRRLLLKLPLTRSSSFSPFDLSLISSLTLVSSLAGALIWSPEDAWGRPGDTFQSASTLGQTTSIQRVRATVDSRRSQVIAFLLLLIISAIKINAKNLIIFKPTEWIPPDEPPRYWPAARSTSDSEIQTLSQPSVPGADGYPLDILIQLTGLAAFGRRPEHWRSAEKAFGNAFSNDKTCWTSLSSSLKFTSWSFKMLFISLFVSLFVSVTSSA